MAFIGLMYLVFFRIATEITNGNCFAFAWNMPRGESSGVSKGVKMWEELNHSGYIICSPYL